MRQFGRSLSFIVRAIKNAASKDAALPLGNVSVERERFAGQDSLQNKKREHRFHDRIGTAYRDASGPRKG